MSNTSTAIAPEPEVVQATQAASVRRTRTRWDLRHGVEVLALIVLVIRMPRARKIK